MAREIYWTPFGWLSLRRPLEPFQKFARMLRDHLNGILSWTKTRLSNGAVEGMNNKIKSISHRSFAFRTAENFIAAIYHCCARLPLPIERNHTFWRGTPEKSRATPPLCSFTLPQRGHAFQSRGFSAQFFIT